MRCSRCGNENPGTNRFCGLCGASLLPAAPPAPVRSEVATQAAAQESARDSAAQQTAPVSPSSSSSSSPRATVRVPVEPPSISGPSFLGLNQPAPSARKSSLGHGSHLDRSSGSLDYLLEDDEEPRSGGAAKIFLILVALALAVGFGYLRFRHEGLSSLMSGIKKSPAAAQPSSDSGQAASDGAPSSGTDAGSGSNANPSASGAPSQPAIQAIPDAAAAPASGNPASGNAPSASTDAPSSGARGGAATPPSAAPATTPAAPAGTTKDESAAPGDAAAADSDPNKAPSGTASVPKRPVRPRTTPKPTPATVRDPVSEAEKYIYGRGGALQDCDRGLRLLRPAAEQANPRAMISLGALYTTGVCTPRDLPTAYRWFALALRKQPDNQPLQENLQRLWTQMTQPERQLAIKLSQ